MAKNGKQYAKISGTWEQIKPSYDDLTDVPTDFNPTTHTHGNMNDDGQITAEAPIATGDHLVIADNSANNDLTTSSITFDTTNTTQFLRKDGTFATPAADTNNYLTGVSGSGDGTVTFTRTGLSNLTWDASHSHSEYLLTTAKAADSQLLDGLDSANFINNTHTTHSANDLAVGWYTIATVPGNRGIARFGLRDTDSGNHQSVIFYAAHHYGTDASNTLTVLHQSSFGSTPFRYIRIKEGGTYDGAALQVYIDKAQNNIVAYLLGDNFQSSGWTLKDWIPDATDPGNVSNYSSFVERGKIDLDNITQGGMATTGQIYAGGDTTQYKVFHDAYHPNADKWTTARTITLGGDLVGNVSLDGSANVTLSAAVANDSHTHDGRYYTESEVNTYLAAKAPLASPALTGIPTAPTAAANTNTTQIATTAYVQTEISDLIGGAPGALDTLNELAAAINDDASYASTITTALAAKAPLASPSFTGNVSVSGTITANGLTVSNDNIVGVNQLEINDPGEGIVFKQGSSGDMTLAITDDSFDSILNFSGTNAALAVNGTTVSLSGHTHDDRYYTESEVDTLLSGKAASSHTHDDRYYTESEVNTLLAGKASSSHTHSQYLESAGDTMTGDLVLDHDGTGTAADSHALRFTARAANTDFSREIKLEDGGGFAFDSNILLTGDVTTNNAARTIDFTGFDKEGTTDFTDRAFIQHTTNTGGHSGSVLVISSQNDSSDGIAFQTNGSSQLKHNSNTIWDAGNDGPGSGLNADLLDGNHASAFYLASNPSGYTSNTGTVTSLSAGIGLDIVNATTTPSITLDLSEFTDMTADVVGTSDELILLDNGAERRKLISEIKLSQFNNDAGWTSNSTLTTEQVQDIVGGMVSSNSETGLSVAYDDTNGKLNFALTNDPTITLTGDVSGSGTMTNLGSVSITATVADDSHNHTISNVDGLQTALDGKAASSHQHAASNITSGEFATARLGSGNANTNYVLKSDGDGTASWQADSQLSTEAVQDIVGGMVSTNTESGIAVTYDDTNGKLNFNVSDPTITLTGDVTGSATMTNLGNVSITATVADDSHNHTIANVDGLQTALNGKLGTTATAAQASAVSYVTSCPTSNNTTGMKVYVGSTDCSTKYSGWLYLVT